MATDASAGPPLCDNGCGRCAFRNFASCCVHCANGCGHNRDCLEKHQQTLASFESSKKRKRAEADEIAAPKLEYAPRLKPWFAVRHLMIAQA